MQKLVATVPVKFLPKKGNTSASKGPVKVYDFLYLGSRSDARNSAKLKQLGITAIVDCAPEYKTIEEKIRQCNKLIEHKSNSINTLKLDLHDDERVVFQFREAAEQAIAFIDEQQDNKQKVLVCCHLGTSRAAGIVLAYMMRKQDISYELALGQLRNLCDGTDQVILPNRFIEALLSMWE